MSKRLISIIAPFNSLDSSYSVASVVKGQIRTLQEYGFDVELIVNQGFDRSGLLEFKKVKIHSILPISKERITASKFSNLVMESRKYLDVLEPLLKNTDICITHDLILLEMFELLNLACRIYSSQNSDVKWFNWVHSLPLSLSHEFKLKLIVKDKQARNILKFKFQNSKIVFLNHTDKSLVKRYFGSRDNDIIVINNFVDAETFYPISAQTKSILQDISISDYQIIMVYPTRTALGKQLDKLVDLTAFLKDKGLSVLTVICNTNGHGREGIGILAHLRMLKENYRLTNKNLIITSELGFNRIDNTSVKELLQISNVVVLPSVTEAGPLLLYEASLAKNLIFVNKKVKLYSEFDNNSLIKIDFSDDKVVWLNQIYKQINKQLKINPILSHRVLLFEKFNNKYIFKTQFLPYL